MFVFLSVAVGILYKLAPNMKVPFRWCVAGGAIFSVGWLVATGLFGFYVSNFANYANTYGALGGVIVLMLWFYISAFILVAAAALIAAALKELRPAVVEEGKPAPKAETATDDAKKHEERDAGGRDADRNRHPLPPRAVAPGLTASISSIRKTQLAPTPPRRRAVAMAHRQ